MLYRHRHTIPVDKGMRQTNIVVVTVFLTRPMCGSKTRRATNQTIQNASAVRRLQGEGACPRSFGHTQLNVLAEQNV